MDLKNQNKKELASSHQLLKQIIPQLLLSLSLFSFLFSYSSSLFKSQYYFSTDSLHFLSHALSDKNCLFLICNGLLVFLAKTSGFIRPPELDDGLHKRIGESLQTALEKYVLEEVAVHDKEEVEDEDEDEEKRDETTAEEVSIFVAESEEELGEDHDEKDENDRRFWLFDDEEDEDEEEDEEEMSTEELNKKVEDFIRRMKEEIIINEMVTLN